MNDIIINNSNIWIASRHCFKNSVGRTNKHFKKMWKIGGWRFYITHNLRLKNSQMRDQERDHNGICDVKCKLWDKHDCCCEMCGKKIDKFCHSQVHHILAWWRFPQFETDERNLMLYVPNVTSIYIQTRFLNVD